MKIRQSAYCLDILLNFGADGIGIEQLGYSNYFTNLVILEPDGVLPLIRALLPEGYEIREKEVQGE